MLSFGIVLFASELQTRLVYDTEENKVGAGAYNQSTNQHKPLLDPRRDQRNADTEAFFGEMFGDDH